LKLIVHQILLSTTPGLFNSSVDIF